jgi:intracellular sulfur oxidation DsrE/DsrF family protein
MAERLGNTNIDAGTPGRQTRKSEHFGDTNVSDASCRECQKYICCNAVRWAKLVQDGVQLQLCMNATKDVQISQDARILKFSREAAG